ncbi:MAG: S-methyl-5-thioribose kinase [Pseudomonadota bacterium]
MTTDLTKPEAMLAAVTQRPAVQSALGASQTVNWEITELSDGNMNSVFRVTGPEGSIIAKHAPPYIRVIGEDWPFPQSRLGFEQAALQEHQQICPDYVPQILDFDADQSILILQDLKHHKVARQALIDADPLPHFGRHIGEYLALSLFKTSDLALDTTQKKALLGRFTGNAELCATTESVIFNGPYWAAPLNRWSDQLNTLVEAWHQDRDLHFAAAKLNHAFRTKTQALIHGDLHTGSVMVTPKDTRVMDHEWAFYGPIGFDIGAIIGNLFIAYFAQPGHGAENRQGKAIDRQAYAEDILTIIRDLWLTFSAEFRRLAHEARDTSDRALLTPKQFDHHLIDRFIDQYLADLLRDTAGFAGAKMTRRVIGISHVADLELIEDPALRAKHERQVLVSARGLILNNSWLQRIDDLIDLAISTTV